VAFGIVAHSEYGVGRVNYLISKLLDWSRLPPESQFRYIYPVIVRGCNIEKLKRWS
jgi:hypothetical protein